MRCLKVGSHRRRSDLFTEGEPFQVWQITVRVESEL